MKRALILAAVVTVSTPLSSVAAITSSEAARLATAARVVQDIRSEIQGDYWTRARDVALAAGNEAGAERTTGLLAAVAP